jgi:hypothetical protein
MVSYVFVVSGVRNAETFFPAVVVFAKVLHRVGLRQRQVFKVTPFYV